MPPLDERPPQGDRRKRVAGVTERDEQEAPRLGLTTASQVFSQTSSASSRTIRTRAAGSTAIGVQISVPTPASR